MNNGVSTIHIFGSVQLRTRQSGNFKHGLDFFVSPFISCEDTYIPLSRVRVFGCVNMLLCQARIKLSVLHYGYHACAYSLLFKGGCLASPSLLDLPNQSKYFSIIEICEGEMHE